MLGLVLFMAFTGLLAILAKQPGSFFHALELTLGTRAARQWREGWFAAVRPLERLVSVTCSTTTRTLWREPAALLGVLDCAALVASLVFTYLSARVTNSPNVPILAAIWLPAAIVLPMSLWNLRRALVLGVLTEILAAMLLGVPVGTWVVAGFVGPLATRWLGRRYQLGPANWNISAIRLALFAGTIVSAAAGLTGLLVFASSNTHWMLELARWLVSDTIAAQTLGVLHLRYRWKLVRELRTPNNAIGEV